MSRPVLTSLCVILWALPSESQHYDLVTSDQAQTFIEGVWESHPADLASFPGDGYVCERNPIEISKSETGLSISANDRNVQTEVTTKDGFDLQMDLSPIFDVTGDYSMFFANSSLAFVTLPASKIEVEDVTLYPGDTEPEVTTRRAVVRLIKCKDPERVS